MVMVMVVMGGRQAKSEMLRTTKSSGANPFEIVRKLLRSDLYSAVLREPPESGARGDFKHCTSLTVQSAL